tara:strand:- start:82 stop:1077 length:996 start_codon:yes stop_codon:yes gene_type:complete
MRVVVAGAAHWHAPWHVAALRKHGHVIAGIWDVNAEVAHTRGQMWTAPVYDSLESLLAGSRADLAIFAPRTVDAPSQLARLIDHGIPTVAEKPLGLSAQHFAELVPIAEAKGRFIAVTFVNRLSPAWQAISGPVGSASFRIINGSPERYVEDGVDWVTDAARSGGGALRNLGIHGADAICRLAGESRLEVTSALLAGNEGWDIELHAFATVRSSDGWVATLEAGYDLPTRNASEFEWRIGTERALVVDRDTTTVLYRQAGAVTESSLSSAERYDEFIRRTLDDLSQGRPPIASLADALKAARLVDEVYRVARSAHESETNLGRNGTQGDLQ